jgi:hypothetical protein
MSKHAPEIDYDVGDEVVCVFGKPAEGWPSGFPVPPIFVPTVGHVYRCTEIETVPGGKCECGGTLAASISDAPPWVSYCASSFRKVQTIDVADFLKATKGQNAPKVLEPA